jgi:protocatechuate 4,5-dioxygenase beta chain/2,3-dihydroxyphenylpropionate 1,2-dioxygenase
MPIVASFITSHAPGMTGFPQAADPQQRDRVFAAFETLRRRIETIKPDLVVGVSNDHFSVFFDPMPASCIGLGEKFSGPNSDFERLMGLKCQDYQGHPDYARELLHCAYELGFEPAYARGDLVFEDQFPVPLHFLDPGNSLPIVPIFLNCMCKPMLSLERAYAMGQVLARVAERRPERVLVLATGGLSHWVGTPEEGQINGDFEQEVLNAFKSGKSTDLFALTDAEIEAAGNGAHEIRNWLVASGATPGHRFEVLAHEPIHAWTTGIVVGAFEL